jgi:pyruvate dehydrogenase E1 component alpha subunit
MRGADPVRLVAQAIGKSGGYTGGRSVPFSGPVESEVVPWVAGDLGTSLGVATGAALALTMSVPEGVVVCTFGDGTANRGDFHESVNLSAVWNLPIVFVCQNNGWAISQRAADYLRAPVHARASGYGIPGLSVDGQDLEAVRVAVTEATQRARMGGGPTLVEALTLRAKGHWAGDSAGYRRPNEVAAQVDPLNVLGSRLIERGLTSAAELGELTSVVEREVADAIVAAQQLPDLTADDLGTEQVYA